MRPLISIQSVPVTEMNNFAVDLSNDKLSIAIYHPKDGEYDISMAEKDNYLHGCTARGVRDVT
jgi:hypothetical protein